MRQGVRDELGFTMNVRCGPRCGRARNRYCWRENVYMTENVYAATRSIWPIISTLMTLCTYVDCAGTGDAENCTKKYNDANVQSGASDHSLGFEDEDLGSSPGRYCSYLLPK